MSKLQLLKRRVTLVAGSLVLSAVLAGCGSSGGGSPASTNPPAQQPSTPPSAVSQFISLVMSIIDTADADTKEPDENAGNVTPATSETDEPVEVTL